MSSFRRLPDSCAPRLARLRTAILVASSVFIGLAAGPAAGERSSRAAARSLSLDHVVLAVNDLEAMAARYRQLGFALKPGRRHANGIRNQHVKFGDGTELELLAAPEARDPLTARYRRHLADGDGPAFLALFPQPRPVETEASPSYVFFGQRNHSPTDRPEHFRHRNTAVRLSAVWLAGDDFAAERAFLKGYGIPTRRGRLDALDADCEIAELADRGRLYLLPVRFRLQPARPLIGVTMQVRNVDDAARLLRAASVRVMGLPEAVLIPPDIAGGMWLALTAGLATMPRRDRPSDRGSS